jgi:hypothetical protein
MLQRIWPFLFAICAVSGCRNGAGPIVTVCILDPERGALQCASGADESVPFEMPIADAMNYVCLSPSDARALLHACTKGRL